MVHLEFGGKWQLFFSAGIVQGQVGQGWEQPGLMEGVGMRWS